MKDILAHLDTLTGPHGLFEHADFVLPRFEHGYCTDDNARLLIITSRETDEGLANRLSRVALSFCKQSMTPSGLVHNRMDLSGRWYDVPTFNDCWGRCLWGLGVAAAHHDDPNVQLEAHQLFAIGAQQRSKWSRAMAFAALGAAEILTVNPTNNEARSLLRDAVITIGDPLDGKWRWPESHLTYANATLAEALIAAGAILDDDVILENGLTMLEWLLERESRSGWLSVTGTHGRNPSELDVQFDQQPIEVGAIADACWRAYSLTSNPLWATGVLLAQAWFEGSNDSRVMMYDPLTGGGFDGLQQDGANLNQGAESTIAFVSTGQRAREINLVLR